jgi:hypothetical protein
VAGRDHNLDKIVMNIVDNCCFNQSLNAWSVADRMGHVADKLNANFKRFCAEITCFSLVMNEVEHQDRLING